MEPPTPTLESDLPPPLPPPFAGPDDSVEDPPPPLAGSDSDSEDDSPLPLALARNTSPPAETLETLAGSQAQDACPPPVRGRSFHRSASHNPIRRRRRRQRPRNRPHTANPRPPPPLALPHAPLTNVEAGFASLHHASYDLEAEFGNPLATVPCIPRSLVLPLATVIDDLGNRIADATAQGQAEELRLLWLVFLSLPRLVLHCLPRDMRQDNQQTSLASLLQERLHDFQAGRWDTLFESARKMAPRPIPPDVPVSGNDERKWTRACLLASLGELRRAMQCLLSLGLAPGAPGQLAAALRTLLRCSADPSHTAVPTPASDQPLQLNPKIFRKALLRGGRGSAPGPSGWRYEHLRTVLQLPGSGQGILRVSQLLVSSSVPPDIVELLGAASLTPLAKPAGGVRPLAVGEVLRRITARAVCMQAKDCFANDLVPHQFAVGLMGGCEAILKCIEVRVHEDPDLVVIALDVRNAYNHILRGTCLQSLFARRPELAAFASLFYKRRSMFRFRGADGSVHSLPADEGVEQGDSFAPALFAYGLHPALAHAQLILDEQCVTQGIPTVSILAYLDDIVILAPPEVAELAMLTVRNALRDICGLELTNHKTQVWTPRQVRPPGSLSQHWCPDGIVVLGGPLEAASLSAALAHDVLRPSAFPVALPAGTFVQEFVSAKLDGMRRAADLVVQLPTKAPHDFPALQIALQLLVYCVAPKADHLLRHLPPSVGAPLGSSVDQLLLETLQSMFGVQLSARQAVQATFSLSEGGLGLRARCGGYAAAAYIGSWALVYHKVAATLNWCLPECDPEGPTSLPGRHIWDGLRTCADAGSKAAPLLSDPSWWEAALHGPVLKIQRALGREVRWQARQEWLARATFKQKARLHMHGGWGSGAALVRCPTEVALRLPDEAVRVALCERLGIALCRPGRCGLRFLRSGRQCREHRRCGDHVHCCKGTAGARTRFRHNPLAEEFGRILSSAGRFVELELRDPTMGPHARLDIVEFASAVGGPAAYDVSIVTALRKDRRFVEHCARAPGYASRNRHDHKLSTQYANRLPGARLFPLVVEVGGRWHSSVPPLLRQLAREHVRHAFHPSEASGLGPVGHVVSRWMARLSAALIRGNAAVHRRAGYTPPGPMTADPSPGDPLAHLVPEGDSAYELLVS